MTASGEPRAPELALFPLGTVLYPGGLLPLRIFEPRYVDMVSRSMRSGTPFGIVPITEGSEVGAPARFHPFGTSAVIVAWDQGGDGLLHVEIEGRHCFRVTGHTIRRDRLIVGQVAWVDPDVDAAVPSRFAYLRKLLEEIFERHREQVPYASWELDSGLWVAHRLAEVLPLALADKIAILEQRSSLEKLAALDTFLGALKRSAPKS